MWVRLSTTATAAALPSPLRSPIFTHAHTRGVFTQQTITITALFFSHFFFLLRSPSHPYQSVSLAPRPGFLSSGRAGVPFRLSHTRCTPPTGTPLERSTTTDPFATYFDLSVSFSRPLVFVSCLFSFYFYYLFIFIFPIFNGVRRRRRLTRYTLVHRLFPLLYQLPFACVYLVFVSLSRASVFVYAEFSSRFSFGTIVAENFHEPINDDEQRVIFTQL